MNQPNEKIKHVLTTFFKSTRIEALYFDNSLDTFSCGFYKYMHEDFKKLSGGKIEGFLSTAFKEKNHVKGGFYSYFLSNNIVCNITILYDGGNCTGAIVTQPISLNAHRGSDIELMLNNYELNTDERDSYKRALLRMPIVPCDRISSIGETLALISRSLDEETETRQIFLGGDDGISIYQYISPEVLPVGNHRYIDHRNHIDYSVYLRIKECISKGDVSDIIEAMNNINVKNTIMDNLDTKDVVRSMKDIFIRECSMCCFIAIESGTPYNKAITISDEFVTKVGTLDNVNDIYELMKSSLIAFTRAVAVTRLTAHSKPVRLVMEYIENHYNEKITLEMLAEKVNLSSSYLSSIIKKETGISLAENINKIRIEESKKILLKSNVNITELASMVGYNYSNHFARLFKQFTGMTPLKFKNSIHEEEDENNSSNDTLKIMSSYFVHTLSVFPGAFDVFRIVDPVKNISWQQQGKNIVQNTCYDFWEKKKSCDKCISHMACERNSSFMKLEKRGDENFFVFAMPVTVGNKRYALELLKETADNFFDCTAG